MARFQASTDERLEAELASLCDDLGLRTNQKADLLRELVTITTMAVQQAKRGRALFARGEKGDVELAHPIFERVRARARLSAPSRSLSLGDEEVERLADLMTREFEPTPALRASLRRLADLERSAPRLSWPSPDPLDSR